MADIRLNQLPSGWAWTTLGEIAELVGGGTPSRKVPEYFAGDIVWLTPTEVPKEKIATIYDSKERITEEALHNSSAKLVPAGTVLLTSRASIGYVAIAGTQLSTNQGFASFICANGVHNLCLAYWLWTNAEEFKQLATGTTFKEITKSKLREIPIALPPTNEQIRIADEIEVQLSRLDTWLEVMRKLREQLPRLRASILKAAVDGHLVEQDPDDESAEDLLQRILDERRRKWEEDYLEDLEVKDKPAPKDDTWKDRYPEPEVPDTDRLPKLPEGWLWVSLDQCSWHSGYGTSQRSDYSASGAPVLRIPNIVDGSIDLTDLKFATDSSDFDEARALQPNDLLIIRTNGSKALLGRIALISEEFTTPHYYASYLIRYRLVSITNLPQWVAVAWDSNFVRGWIDQIASTSAGQYNINIANLNKTPIPLPPSNQQVLITEDIEYRFSVIDQLLKSVDINIKRAARLRQSILKKAFEGRLVEQDPGDEPASELLKRIQEERQRRTEEQKQKPRQQRERKVSSQTERKSLYETLKVAGRPLSAHELFQQAGFTHMAIDDFYEELREAVHVLETIRSKRNENNEVYLEVIG